MFILKSLDLLNLLDNTEDSLIDDIVLRFNKSKILCLKNFTPLEVKFGDDKNFEYKKYLIGELFNLNNFSIKKHKTNNFYSFNHLTEKINFVINKNNFKLFVVDENENNLKVINLL